MSMVRSSPAAVQSVNVGIPRPIRAKSGLTGIDKRPTERSVKVFAPGPKGIGGSGVEGDAICDRDNHGGDDQAVYAFAREDLDRWETELREPLRSGVFGENLTTLRLDVTNSRIGETWRIGDELLLQVTGPRIPCATFAAWMRREGWLKMFTTRAQPGAYLRVLVPGSVREGDSVAVEFRPTHDVTIGLAFRALTLEKDLLPRLWPAVEYLDDETIGRVRKREPFEIV